MSAVDLASYLQSNPVCPVCQSGDRSDFFEQEVMSNDYLNTLASYLQVDTNSLLTSILRAYQCRNCTTIYCDPWLNSKTSAMLYGLMYGQHRAGWAYFHRWARGELASDSSDHKKLWQIIQQQFRQQQNRDIEYYAEVQCPFTGLLLDFADTEQTSQAKQQFAAAFSALQKSYRDFPQSGFCYQPEENLQLSTAPSHQYLINQPSELIWSQNCNFGCMSCHAVANMLDITSVTLPAIEKRQLKFDVIGFFHVLDHYADPMFMLRMAFERSQLVVIETHDYQRIDKQHLFVFGHGFADYLKRCGFSILDVTAEVAQSKSTHCSYRCYLASATMTISL